MYIAWMAALKPGKSYKAYQAGNSLLLSALRTLYSALFIQHDNVRGAGVGSVSGLVFSQLFIANAFRDCLSQLLFATVY